MAEKLNYKNIAIQASLTAVVFAFINRILSTKKGLGMAMKTLAFLPIEHQARFADAVTVENARNPKWLIEQISNIDPKDPNVYKTLNQASIGNCAYIGLYGTNEIAKRKCLKILENIKNGLV